MTAFAVTSRHEAGSLIVTPRGELDIATVGAVRDELAQRGPEEGVVVDFTQLDFLDTSGIALAVEVHRASSAENGFDLRILRAPARVQRVFEIAGLEGVLPFEDGPGA